MTILGQLPCAPALFGQMLKENLVLQQLLKARDEVAK